MRRQSMPIELALQSFIQRRYLAIVILVLLAAVAGVLVAGFKVENSIESWVDQDNPHYQNYQQLVETFGDDATVQVVFERDELTPERLAGYLDFIDDMRGDPAVSFIFDPVELFLLDESGEALDPQAIRTLQRSASRRVGDYRNALVSEDAQVLGTLFLLARGQEEAHPAALARIRRGMDVLGFSYDVAGTAYVSQTIADTLTRDITLVVSSLMTLSIIVLLLAVRNVFVVASVFLAIVVSVIFTLAYATLLGIQLNLLSLVLFPLIFCVGLTTAIHLFTRGRDGEWQFDQAWLQVSRPASLAMLTTMLGSSAFVFAPQTVVRDMGKVVPFGILVTFVMVMLLAPAAYRLLAGKWTLRLKSRGVYRPGRAMVNRSVALSLIVAGLLSLPLLPRLTTEPDAIFFFKPDSALMQGYQRIEDRLTGLLVVEMMVTATDGDKVTSAVHRQQLQAFVQNAGELPALTTVVSPLPWLHSPGQMLVPEDIQRVFVTEDESRLRLSFRFRNISDVSYAADARALQRLWDSGGYRGLEMRLTGLIPLILEAQDSLLKTQAVIFPLILLIMTVVLGLAVRSVPVLVYACIANFLPLLIVVAAMALLAIPVNSINLFVASVMLGVIVDDTIHLLHAWQKFGDIDAALAEVRPALWITSVTLALAFVSLLLSSMTPINQFGLLSLVAIVSAYLCDVYLLPWLIRRREARA